MNLAVIEEGVENPMMRFRFFVKLAVLLFLISSIFPSSAYAYLDPGTGSFIIQVVLATFVGMAFTTKLWFRKVVSLLTYPFGGKRRAEQGDS